MSSEPKTHVKTVKADGVEVFYREAGPANASTILLLHGFPSSSFQYRNLIPILATKYHVIAPDLPGYGFTEVPDSRKYEYTFASFAKTIGAFVDALDIKTFAIYVFDYGAPTGFRLALERPQSITAIISQNGNAYEDGLGKFWDPAKVFWKDRTEKTSEPIAALITLKGVTWQYLNGAPHPETVPPEAYNLDYYLVNRPGNPQIQLDVFWNYQTNLPEYPKFQEYFRKYQPPTLAIWGKYDEIFIPPGAEAYKRDNPKAEVKLLDGGHFTLETHLDVIATEILAYLAKHNV
ncbi:hypothetical protein NM688_g8776 [Phlebia brevispora]|uniref:Uncharacterized protein n=1 Tax=Phlebia brevispora TaxID=194682 RepID=A0ACC1RQT8_9APHY|nr:hypothetical protein NM688_g8776 [Phlebia brevispora]